MIDTDIEAPALLVQLVEKCRAPWVAPDTIDAWLAGQRGNHVLLFAGDPVRFPEGLDVAVVLPELHRALAGAAKAFSIAVAVPDFAQQLALRFGSQRWPSLVFFRDGSYVTTLSGMHDWTDFLRLMEQCLEMPVSRPPGVGIAVVSAQTGSSSCH
jgi:hydrogenase-1 operon protein HyaE